MAAKALADIGPQSFAGAATAAPIDDIDLEGAQSLLMEIDRAVSAGKIAQRSLSQAVATEIAIAAAEKHHGRRNGGGCDPLFRLHCGGWAVGGLDPVRLVPVNNLQFQVL